MSRSERPKRRKSEEGLWESCFAAVDIPGVVRGDTEKILEDAKQEFIRRFSESELYEVVITNGPVWNKERKTDSYYPEGTIVYTFLVSGIRRKKQNEAGNQI